LLADAETACDAADALGRIGPAAQSALKALAPMLSAEGPAARWAAVRAMSQIGGADAAPVVQFMIQQLPTATEANAYNMMIYLALLGPVAKDAVPAIRKSRVPRNPVLKQVTVWAIDSSAELPALGPLGDVEFVHYILEAYVQELGDHLKPAAQSLATKIMAGKAGTVQGWGYKLLARFPEQSLAILTPGLADKELVMRERVTVALGYMGRAASAARPQVDKALKSTADEQEQRWLRWCLREME
jgi:HEAT repeat protein